MGKRKKNGRGRPATGQMKQRQLRVSDDDWEAWGRAAKKQGGQSRAEFVRTVVNAVCDRLGVRASRRKPNTSNGRAAQKGK